MTDGCVYPADYVAHLLECLTALCHFCLLDPLDSQLGGGKLVGSPSATSIATVAASAASTSGSKATGAAVAGGSGSGFSIMRAFRLEESAAVQSSDSDKQLKLTGSLLEARLNMLARLSNIFSR